MHNFQHSTWEHCKWTSVAAIAVIIISIIIIIETTHYPLKKNGNLFCFSSLTKFSSLCSTEIFFPAASGHWPSLTLGHAEQEKGLKYSLSHHSIVAFQGNLHSKTMH